MVDQLKEDTFLSCGPAVTFSQKRFEFRIRLRFCIIGRSQAPRSPIFESFFKRRAGFGPRSHGAVAAAPNCNCVLVCRDQRRFSAKRTRIVFQATVSNRKRDLVSHLTSRSVCIFLPRLVYIPDLSLIPTQVPDFNEQTRVSNGHPRCNSKIYPRFLPQLEKTHETFPFLRHEARFPCIVSRANAFSQSNT